MGQLVTVAKAAHTLGVSRHELQELIRSGGLNTFEGRLDLSELREHYPLMSVDESPMLERVKNIKATAFGRRLEERISPAREELETQLRRKILDHDVAKAEARRYREILEEMAKLLQVCQQSENKQESELGLRLSRWLAERLHN